MIGSILRTRYELTGTIADGPIFASYSARDRVLGKEVCVRVIKQTYSTELPFLEALKAAIRKYGVIHHPGVEAISELDHDDSTSFLVGDLTRGPLLSERIRKLAPFSIPVSVSTAISICQGLDSIHRLQLVHGDLQTSNIAVLQDGEVRLQLTGIWEAYSASTTAGVVVLSGMSPNLAPEISAGGMPSVQSDVYSVGILLFELLSGRRPYHGETPIAMALQHTNAPTPRVRSVNPSVPSVLDEIVARAMAKNPLERYEHAGELLSDLRVLQDALRFGRSLSWPIRSTSGIAAAVVSAPNPVAPKMSAIRSEEIEEKPERDVPIWMLVVFTFLAAVAVSLLGVWMFYNLQKPKLVPVPNVQGLSAGDARAMLTASHLQMRITQRTYNDRYEMDRVLDADPPAGSKVREGGTIMLTVSAGSRTVEIPDLKGDTVDKAKAILGNLGLDLSPDIQRQNIPGATPDAILSQDPPPRSRVPRGSRVTVVIDTAEIGQLFRMTQRPVASAEPTPPAPDRPENSNPDALSLGVSEPRKYVYNFKMRLTDLPAQTQVKVEMIDAVGKQVIHDQPHMAGDIVKVEITGTGSPAKFKIYYDNRLVKTYEKAAPGIEP